MRVAVILGVFLSTCNASVPEGVPPMPPKQPLQPFYYIADKQGRAYASVLENAYGEAMDMVEKACLDLQLLLGDTPDQAQDPAGLQKWVKTARAAYHMFGIEADRNRRVQRPQTKEDVLVVIRRYTKLREVNTGKAPPNKAPPTENFRIFTKPGFEKRIDPAIAHWSFEDSELYDPGTNKLRQFFVLPQDERFRPTPYWLEPSDDSLSESMVKDNACSLYEAGVIAFNPNTIIKKRNYRDKRFPPILLSHLPPLQAYDSKDAQGQTLINYISSTKLESRDPETSLSMTFLHELLHLHDIDFKDYEVSTVPNVNVPAGYPAWSQAPAYGWLRVTAKAIDNPTTAKLLPDAYVYFAVSAWYDNLYFARFDGTAARLQKILNTDWDQDHRGQPPVKDRPLVNGTIPLRPRMPKSWPSGKTTAAAKFLRDFMSNLLASMRYMA